MRHLIAAGAARLEVLEDGAGPAIVLLPSFGRGADDFDPLVAGLVASGYTAIRPQPRGSGATSGPTVGLSYQDWADDVAAVITALSPAPAIVCGHAAGNRFARLCAATHPELVRGVVLAATSADGPPAEELSTALATASDPQAPREARLSALRLAFFAPGSDPEPWLAGWVPATARALRATVQIAWSNPGSVPVLDLQAELDPWRPISTRRQLQESLGADQVTVSVIAKASHALLPERPAEVVTALAGWAATQLI
jgi:pimeloyl-ACP methyl ester carboxylesterase